MELIFYTGWGPGTAYATFGCDLSTLAGKSKVRRLDHPGLNEEVSAFGNGVGVTEGVQEVGISHEAPLVIHARQVISKPTRDGWRRSGYEVVAVVDVPEGALSQDDLNVAQEKLADFLANTLVARKAAPDEFSTAAPFLQRLDDLASDLRAAWQLEDLQRWSEPEPQDVKEGFWTASRMITGAVAVFLVIGGISAFSILQPEGDVVAVPLEQPDAPVMQRGANDLDPEPESLSPAEPVLTEVAVDDMTLVRHWNGHCHDAQVAERDTQAWLDQPGVRNVLSSSLSGEPFDPFSEEWQRAGEEWRQLLVGSPASLEIICRRKLAIGELRTALEELVEQASAARARMEEFSSRNVDGLISLYDGILSAWREPTESSMAPVFGSADWRLMVNQVPDALCALMYWSDPDYECNLTVPVSSAVLEGLPELIAGLRREERYFLEGEAPVSDGYRSLLTAHEGFR